MEININLFHQKPMFSFRCKKEDKKRIKKLAKECDMDVDEFIIDASKKYRSMSNGIPFEFFRKIITPGSPVVIFVWGEDKFYKCIEDVGDEYNDYRVMNFTPFVCDGHAEPEFDGRIMLNISLLQCL